MKLWLIGALMTAAVATTALPFDADAKRLGAGRASGMQRNMPARTAPDAPPPKPAQPAQAQPNQAAPAAAAAPAATPPKRSWMGPLAGLAAGLGLAALFSHMGLGAGAANIMMMVLLIGALAFGAMFLLRRFGGGRQPALAGAGGNAGGSSAPSWMKQEPAMSPAPMQRTAESSMAPVAAAPAALASGPPPAVEAPATQPQITRAFVPAAFDSEGFARTAKMIFIRLQAANDTADLDDLRRFTTPELFASLRVDLQDRGTAPQHTDVTQVDAEVLDVANEADRQVVSVRFHGQMVEEKGAAPTAFNEVWHLVKPHDDSRSWAIAGIEPLN